MTGLPVCRCPRSQHFHGTRDFYSYHRCRCVPCTNANTVYYQATAHLTRRHDWAAAEPARRRLILLRDAGLSIPAIAALCNVAPTQLRNLIRGPKGRVVKRVRRSMLDALNAVSYQDVAATRLPPGTYVDGAASMRQLQSLSAAGWSMTAVARKTGIGKGTLISIINGGGAREGTRLRIEAAHKELHSIAPASASRYERSAVGAARARAAANGWTVYEDEDFAYAASGADDYEEAA